VGSKVKGTNKYSLNYNVKRGKKGSVSKKYSKSVNKSCLNRYNKNCKVSSTNVNFSVLPNRISFNDATTNSALKSNKNYI
jgi:hypothetical protein